MVFYALFTLNVGLLLHRLLRSKKWGERTVLVSLFGFLLLTLAMHPWIAKSSWILYLLEKSVLGVNLFWLAGSPFFGWLEKKRRAGKLFSLLRNERGPYWEIITACRMLSEAGQGALIAIQRKDSLAKWIDSSVPLEAKVRRETLFSIFTPPGALHDGGVIVSGERILSAGAIFPLSSRSDLPTELGTRHRAALGMSETTDALAIVVSEETGKISFADKGSLLYDVKPERLAEILETTFKKSRPKREGNRLSEKLRPELVLR